MTTTGSTSQLADTDWSADLIHSRVTLARQVVQRTYESSVVTFEQYASMAIEYAESRTETARRSLTRRRKDLLRDAWGPLLKASFEAWTTPPVQNAVLGLGRDHIDLSRNPAKRVWQELAVLYTAPPVRSTTEATAGEQYNKLVARTKFNLFWKIVEVLCQACNEVLIWPDVIEVDGEKTIRHRYATGDAFTVITSDRDPNVLDCVVIHDEWVDLLGRPQKNWILWTPEWHGVFKKGDHTDGRGAKLWGGRFEIERVDADEFGDARNPYGILPHHLVRRMEWQDTALDATSGEDLVDGTLYGGHAQQFLRYHQKMSGFKQPAVTGGDIEAAPQQLLDPGATLRFVGQDVALQIVDWQLDLKASQDVIDADELRLAASRGINPERYKRTASYQTGFGARLGERPLERLRDEMIPVFAEAEATYYRKACVVWALHGIDAVPEPSAEFHVQYAPMKFPEDPGQQLDVESKELSLLMEDYISLIKRRHPEMSDDEALKMIRAHGENIAEVQRMKVRSNAPTNPQNESASAEENGRMGPVVRDGGQPPGSPPGDASEEPEE